MKHIYIFYSAPAYFRSLSDSAMRFSSPGVLPSSETSPHSSEGSWCSYLVRGITVLLAKDVMKPVPPADMKAGFFSPYIIVPKKSSGLRPILGLRILNWAFHKLPFKMLTQKRIFGCIRPEIGLKWSTWRTRTSMCRSFRATGHSCGLRSKDGHISTTSCPSGCPYRHMSSRK